MVDNIILVGYRGTGKSSVSEALGKILQRSVYCTDHEFVKQNGQIMDFVLDRGWKEFRKLETEILNKLPLENSIIDCGGGVIEVEDNIEILRNAGIVFWLKTGVPQIIKHIKKSEHRPALTRTESFTDEVNTVMERRIPKYRKVSHFEIDTESLHINEIAKKIFNIYNKKTRLCVPLVKNFLVLNNDIKHLVDLVEIRADLIKNFSIDEYEKFLIQHKEPVIFTCRPNWEGGKFADSESERLQLLKAGIDSGSEFIDVEYNSDFINQFSKSAVPGKIIISSHDFEKTPSFEELEILIGKIKSLNPDLVKIVTTANSINDNFTVFHLLKQNVGLTMFCMGLFGQISRILGAKYLSEISFAALKEDQQSASGQISLEEMHNVYHFSKINPRTKVFGVIGKYAENSKSKYIHNAMFRANNLNSVFMPFKILDKKDLNEFMQNFRDFNFTGASVTIPFKEAIIDNLDVIDETAQKIGAVNTIKNRNGKLYGYNTDCIGAVRALTELENIKEKRVLILGAGGASRAVIYGLLQENCKITIANRTLSKAEKLATDFGIKVIPFMNISQLFDQLDIIINTTSVGMIPDRDESLIDEKDFPKNKIVMDIVYNPIKTKFIRNGEKAECKVVTGEKMLIFQAMEQFKIWTSIEPDFEDMAQAFYKYITE